MKPGITGSSSFVRQAAILGLASLFVRFIGFLYRIPLTDLMGDDGMGFYTRAYFIYTFAVAVSSGALPAAVSRLVSERIAHRQFRNAHELFKTAMGFAVVWGAVIGLGMGFGAEFIADFFDAPESAHGLRALAPAIVVVAMLAVFRGYFQGMKTAIPTAVSQVVEQIFNVVFTVWLAWLFFDAANLQYAVAGGTAGTGIGAVAGVAVVAVMYALVAKDLKARARADVRAETFERRRRQLRAVLLTAFPVMVGMGVYALSTILDFGMASDRMAASGAFELDEINDLVGQFNNKFILFTSLPVSLSVALSAAVIPEITTAQVEMDNDAIRNKTNMALRISMMLTIPAAVGLAVLADDLVALLFPAHPDGGWLIMFGSVSIVFIALVQILTGVLQGIGRVGIPVIGAIFGVMCKIPVNYFLISIPQINILGAVISTIVCYIVASIFNLYFLRRLTGILPNFADACVKPAVASVGMGLVAFISSQLLRIIMPGQVATIGALVFSGLAYFIFMGLIKGFRLGDIDMLPLPGGVKRFMRF